LVALEPQPPVDRAHVHLGIVERDLALETIANQAIPFNGLQPIAELGEPALPSVNLVGVDDELVAVPEADRLAVPLRKFLLRRAVRGAVRVNPPGRERAVAGAHRIDAPRRDDELLRADRVEVAAGK